MLYNKSTHNAKLLPQVKGVNAPITNLI